MPKHSLLMKLANGIAHKGKLNAIYRTCTAYTEGEISGIQRGVLCVHEPYFHMPGHL